MIVREKKQGSYPFFRNATRPKRIAKIARIAPNPGASVWLDEGITVADVVGDSAGDGVFIVVVITACVVTRVVTFVVASVGVPLVSVGIVVAVEISGFTA